MESIKTPKSLAKGTGENPLPSRDNLKLLDTLDVCLVPNTSNLVLSGCILGLF